YERALFRPRIFAVVAKVSDAIHGHGGGTRGNHSDYDPENLAQGWPAVWWLMRGAGGQQRARQSKRQRKNRMLELDHFEHRADARLAHALASFDAGAGWPVQRYICSCGRPICARTRQTY